MTRRKLQIFLSSTYEDLIEQRLVAMEAILAAGHIPAAMEQFSPGDETAWEKIRTWIDESDAFILILGGRYGSIEATSGKSYVQLEYEYAVGQKKPFFALVIKDEHHERRVREIGFELDERVHTIQHSEFKRMVTQRLCGFWGDDKDIKTAIFHKLPEWAQRHDLIGWVRGNEVATTHVTNELARLSEENRDLRRKASAQVESFEGLSFEKLVDLLRSQTVAPIEAENVVFAWAGETLGRVPTNAGEVFEVVAAKAMSDWQMEDYEDSTLTPLISFGLLQYQPRNQVRGVYFLSAIGRRFRNRLLMYGDSQKRINELWSEPSSAGTAPG